jgi:peptidyl-prolyl cis-trans isomerase D
LQGINGEAFENDLSRDIASQQLRTAISTSAFLTENEKNRLSALENQKRKVGYFDVAVKPYRKSISVSDADIQSYYDKNSQSFLTAEKVQLEYIELNMDDVAALQEVTDEMVKEHYESSPESYMASDDTAAEKKLAGLRKQIIEGADFSSLAKKYSQDKGSSVQGGDLGYLTRGVEEKFDEVVFSLNVGEVSQVIKSKQGFQLIKLDDIRKGDPEERKVRHILIKADRKLKSLAEVKDSIKKELKYKQAGKVFFDDADKLNNLSYETPDSLEPAAEALGLKIKTSALMTRSGGTGIFSNPKILSAAFSDDVLKQGRNSELLELSDTQLVVLRVKEHKVASVQPLSNVKESIKNYLLQQQSSKKAQEVSQDVLARINNNESIKSIQKRYPEIKWNEASWITRKPEKNSIVPEQINNQAFAMPKPAANKTTWDKVVLTAGDQAVIGLFNIEEVSEGKIDNDKITQLIGNADYESFIQNLKSQADITISTTALDSDAGKNQ